MYDVVHYRLAEYEVEAQEAALKHQQAFGHYGARQIGTRLSGGAGDLLPGGRCRRCLLHTARDYQTHNGL